METGDAMRGAVMFHAGPDDEIYPVGELATIVDMLAAEGVAAAKALHNVHLSKSDIVRPTTRISLNQMVECCRNALMLSRDPFFAFHTGLRCHVTTFGMYGFAILSSPDVRQAAHFAVRYHQLASPYISLAFADDDDRSIWTILPRPNPRIDAHLYKFLVELSFGIILSLSRDVMGPLFIPDEIRVTYGPPENAHDYSDVFGCPFVFSQSANVLGSKAAWMNRKPRLGNEITYSMVLRICDELMEEMQLRTGLAGKVREVLLIDLMRPANLDAVAKHLHTTSRTLKRKLHEENTSFRKIVDELRMYLAIKYLRDTKFTIEDIAHSWI
jgi:AraC-like DNA-binding protein